MNAIGCCGLQVLHTFILRLCSSNSWVNIAECNDHDIKFVAKEQGTICSTTNHTVDGKLICDILFQLYNFGETVSICFWTDNWKPDSFYDKIAVNRERGTHTLCLLGEKKRIKTP